MDDLLRNSATKEEYRNIREKVRQKQQTFAQLKAEAAKILEDCLYWLVILLWHLVAYPSKPLA